MSSTRTPKPGRAYGHVSCTGLDGRTFLASPTGAGGAGRAKKVRPSGRAWPGFGLRPALSAPLHTSLHHRALHAVESIDSITKCQVCQA